MASTWYDRSIITTFSSTSSHITVKVQITLDSDTIKCVTLYIYDTACLGAVLQFNAAICDFFMKLLPANHLTRRVYLIIFFFLS